MNVVLLYLDTIHSYNSAVYDVLKTCGHTARKQFQITLLFNKHVQCDAQDSISA